jgi:hypothetical protein
MTSASGQGTFKKRDAAAWPGHQHPHRRWLSLVQPGRKPNLGDGPWKRSWRDRARRSEVGEAPHFASQPSDAAAVDDGRQADVRRAWSCYWRAVATQNRQSTCAQAPHGYHQAGGQPTAARKGQAPPAPGTFNPHITRPLSTKHSQYSARAAIKRCSEKGSPYNEAPIGRIESSGGHYRGAVPDPPATENGVADSPLTFQRRARRGAAIFPLAGTPPRRRSSQLSAGDMCCFSRLLPP